MQKPWHQILVGIIHLKPEPLATPIIREKETQRVLQPFLVAGVIPRDISQELGPIVTGGHLQGMMTRLHSAGVCHTMPAICTEKTTARIMAFLYAV